VRDGVRKVGALFVYSGPEISASTLITSSKLDKASPADVILENLNYFAARREALLKANSKKFPSSYNEAAFPEVKDGSA
jgi:hypothetical protein